MKTKQERRQFVLDIIADKLEGVKQELVANPPKRSEMTKPQHEKIVEDMEMLITAFRDGRISVRKG